MLTRTINLKPYTNVNKNQFRCFSQQKEKFISFQPAIWANNLYEKYVIEKMHDSKEEKDPEVICCYSNKERNDNVEFKLFKNAYDVGRQWMKKNNFKKWNYYDNSPKKYSKINRINKNNNIKVV